MDSDKLRLISEKISLSDMERALENLINTKPAIIVSSDLK